MALLLQYHLLDCICRTLQLQPYVETLLGGFPGDPTATCGLPMVGRLCCSFLGLGGTAMITWILCSRLQNLWSLLSALCFHLLRPDMRRSGRGEAYKTPSRPTNYPSPPTPATDSTDVFDITSMQLFQHTQQNSHASHPPAAQLWNPTSRLLNILIPDKFALQRRPFRCHSRFGLVFSMYDVDTSWCFSNFANKQ